MENGSRGKIIIKRILRDVKETFGAGVAFLIYYLIIHSIFNAFCPFLVTTGLPCPGCGLTRAALYLLQGQPGRAAHINPPIFLLLGFAMYCGYFRYIKGSPVRGIKGALAALTAGILILYAVRMYLYFPGRAPYVYQSNNLLAAWVPGYREWMRGILEGIRAWRQGG